MRDGRVWVRRRAVALSAVAGVWVAGCGGPETESTPEGGVETSVPTEAAIEAPGGASSSPGPSDASEADASVGPRASSTTEDRTPEVVVPAGAVSVPPIRAESTPDGPGIVEIDQAAFAAACRALGLPDPPPVGAVDASATLAIHAAVSRIAEARTPEALEELAIVYDGNAVEQPAVELYAELVELMPDRADLAALYGRSLVRLDRWAEAAEVLAGAASRRPDDAATHYRLGDARLATGDPDAAAAAYERYEMLRPGDGLGTYGLARVAADRGDWDEARERLEAAVIARPDLRGGWLLLAQARRRGGDVDGARVAAETAGAIDDRGYVNVVDPLESEMYIRSDSTAALRYTVSALVDAGRLAEARGLATRILERQPRDAAALRNATSIARGLRQFDEALAFADRLVAVDPDDGSAHLQRGLVLRDLRRADEALAAIDRALAAARPDSEAHLAKSTIYLAMRRLDDALSAADAAIEAAPTAVDPLLARASVFVVSGNRPELRATVLRILELDPNHTWARQTLAQLGG